ncbi:thioredoxin domain-containing protein 8 [Sigmodon hispidus]
MEENELKDLLRTAENKLVVVEFSATWCGPCKKIGPAFQEMSLKYKNVVFANVDVDSSQELTEVCNIKVVPTFQMFKHTQKVKLTCQHEGPDALQYSQRLKVSRVVPRSQT